MLKCFARRAPNPHRSETIFACINWRQYSSLHSYMANSDSAAVDDDCAASIDDGGSVFEDDGGGSGITDSEDGGGDIAYLSNDALCRLLQAAAVPGRSSLSRPDLLRLCVEHGLITDAQAAARRSNPARAALMRERRGARETVVKCFLSSLFRKTAAAPARDARRRVTTTIRKCVTYVSKVARRGSVLAWLHFHRLLSSGRELPPLDGSADAQTFFRNFFTAPATCVPELTATWRKYRHVLARLSVPANPVSNSANLLTYLATTFRTNFIVNVWKPLPARLKRAFSVILKDGTIPQPHPRGLTPGRMMQCVEMGTVPTAWPAAAKRLIQAVRSELGVPLGQKLTEAWLKAHLPATLRLTFKLARWLDRKGCRVPSFCPLFAARAHHIRIDGEVLHAIAKRARALPADLPQTMPDGVPARSAVSGTLWQELFPRACKLRGAAAFKLAYTLDTDGVSASVHFRRARTDEDEARATGPLGGGKKKRRQGDGASSSRSVVVDVLDRTITSESAAASYTLAVDPNVGVLAQTALLDPQGQPVVGCNGKPCRWRLTLGQYKCESGAKALDAELAWRRRDLAPVDAALAAQRVRTTYASEFCRYVAAFADYQRPVWRVMLRRKLVALRIRAWMGRRAAVDRFWRRVRAATPPDTIVAYGGATWSSTGRGQLVAPRRSILDGAARQFDTVVMQDEFMTSQTCDACEQRVDAVWRRLRWRICAAAHEEGTDDDDGGVRLRTWHQLQRTRQAGCDEVRGLRFCPNCCKLRARDAMAALNIGKAFRARLHGLSLPQLLDRTAAERAERRTVAREAC